MDKKGLGLQQNMEKEAQNMTEHEAYLDCVFTVIFNIQQVLK